MGRLRESPSDPDLLLAVARACLETGQPEHAFVYLRAAENSASHRGEVRRLMGLAHLRAGDIEQAVDELMVATRSNPEDRELAVALEEALERFTQPISFEDLAGEERVAGDPARAREDEWEATRMDLIVEDGFDIAAVSQPPQRDLEALLDETLAQRTYPAADEPAPARAPRASASIPSFASPRASFSAPRTAVPMPRAAATEPAEPRRLDEPRAPAESLALAEDAALEVERAVFAPAAGAPPPTAPAVGDVEEPVQHHAPGLESPKDSASSPGRPAIRADDEVTSNDPPAAPDAPVASVAAAEIEASTATDARPAPEAAGAEPCSLQVELAGADATVLPRTVSRRGKSGRSRPRRRRMRTKTFAAAALIGAITLGLGAVTTFHSRRDVAKAPPPAAPSPAPSPALAREASEATPEDLAPEEVASEASVVHASALDAAGPDPAPRPRRAAPKARRPVAPERVAEAPPAKAAPEAPIARPVEGPSYEFMDRLGLPVPPGGILDAENSDTRLLVFDAQSSRPPEPSVLTFRTAAGLDEVLAFYTASGIGGFRPRTVQMGGDFQGVERRVARASARGTAGREATITVSHPGVDQAARQLVPETTIRIELF